MTRHYPDLSSASDWSRCCVGNLLQPIRSTTQIWVMTRHQWERVYRNARGLWNFCARFSDVISFWKQWWPRVMSAVFSDYRECTVSPKTNTSKFQFYLERQPRSQGCSLRKWVLRGGPLTKRDLRTPRCLEVKQYTFVNIFYLFSYSRETLFLFQ